MGTFGIYVHIPYCLQICTYCDFVKFEQKDLPPPASYISLLQRELLHRASDVRSLVPSSSIGSIYFGGGTPSLFSSSEIVSIIESIEKAFDLTSDRKSEKCEITLEINPGTLDDTILTGYLDAGITRFSVGAQTFDERALKLTGRKHSVQETKDTLALLQRHQVNYSFDLLFALPGQTLADVRRDVDEALKYDPSHLSAYCLTVPTKHHLNVGRATDDVQAEMFEVIEDDLAVAGLARYEVSNFAKPGFESRHNLLYWSDRPYWGIGIGAHSFLPNGPWGTRFWNPPTVRSWELEMGRTEAGAGEAGNGDRTFLSSLSPDRVEVLELHQALTDFLHTQLRARPGLDSGALARKFPPAIVQEVKSRLFNLVESGLLDVSQPESGPDKESGSHWILSKKGQALADRVFEPLTFLRDEVARL